MGPEGERDQEEEEEEEQQEEEEEEEEVEVVSFEEVADYGAPLGVVQGRRSELPPPPLLCSAAPGPQRAERRGTCRSGLRHPPVGKAQEQKPPAKAVSP